MRKKQVSTPSSRSLVAPILLLGLIASFALTESFFLSLFNLMMGNEVYATTVSCNPLPVTVNGQTSLKFMFDFDIEKMKAPIETIRTNFEINEVPGYHIDLTEPVTVTLGITIYVGGVQSWNRKNLFSYTFVFEDAKSRAITIYLLNLNSAYYKTVYVEVDGSYSLDGLEVPFIAGGTLNIE